MEEVKLIIKGRMSRLDREIWEAVRLQKETDGETKKFWEHQESALIKVWTELKSILEEI